MSRRLIEILECDVCRNEAITLKQIDGLELCAACAYTWPRGIGECGPHRVTLDTTTWSCSCGMTYETWALTHTPARVPDPVGVTAQWHLESR